METEVNSWLIIIGFFAFFFFYWFLHSLKAYRTKRLIENIPSSKVRGVAMGLCEITGIARQKSALKSPLTLTNCVYYRFTEEQKRGSGKDRRWEIVNEGVSTNYFYVEDETGKILVDPLGAETILFCDYNYTEGDTRYKEWCITPGKKVYVLGTVGKFKDDIIDRKEKLRERLKSLKQDIDKLMKFDLNRNGKIDSQEWDTARKQAETELLTEELKNPPKEEDDIVIGKGKEGNAFIISNYSEKETTKKFLFQAVTSGICCLAVIIILFLILRR